MPEIIRTVIILLIKTNVPDNFKLIRLCVLDELILM